MKLKEIPPYLGNKWRLSLLSASKLNTRIPKHELPVIVSLTTIPSRIKIVHLTVRSLLNQDMKPKKVVLWLHESLQGNLPKSLSALEGAIFEICFSPYTFSHRKLIHSLETFPKDVIITADDDIMYPSNFVTLLYETHEKYPDDVIANQVREMRYDDQGNPLPYVEWYHTKKQPTDPRHLMPIGVFGVLYPPNSLDKRVTNVSLFMELTPKADDLWFKAMALLKGTKTRIPIQKSKDPILILGTQKISLKRTNKLEDYNRVQWIRLMEYFKFNEL